MSLNLGNEAINACREMSGNPNWETVRNVIFDLISRQHDTLIDVEPTHRLEAHAYIRGLRDLYVALESATTSKLQRQVARPGPTKAGLLKAAAGADDA
jgi:hypothetical protein